MVLILVFTHFIFKILNFIRKWIVSNVLFIPFSQVSEQLCKPRTDKWCEKFTNEIPFPVEKQNCHNEAMKKCELEVRTRPKKAKQYTYTKECKPVVRQVCEDAEKKKLRPVCDKIQKNVCTQASGFQKLAKMDHFWHS